jgi:hypothetical protein
MNAAWGILSRSDKPDNSGTASGNQAFALRCSTCLGRRSTVRRTRPASTPANSRRSCSRRRRACSLEGHPASVATLRAQALSRHAPAESPDGERRRQDMMKKSVMPAASSGEKPERPELNDATGCHHVRSAVSRLPQTARNWRGRGMVICADGSRYFPCAWVCFHMLRRQGCELPIQLHAAEMNPMISGAEVGRTSRRCPSNRAE